MKKIELKLLTIPLICMVTISFSQIDTSQYFVVYETNHLIDTENIKSLINYPLYLFIGKRSSVSLSKNKYQSDSINLIYKKMAEKSPDNLTISSTGSTRKRMSAFESATIFKDNASNQFYEANIIGLTGFVIEDPVKAINWKLLDSYKEILGYKCQQAKALVSCREWVVWFTNELPISSGPWKLYGLPGLIMEAEDAKKQVSFKVLEITEKAEIIELPKKGFTKCSRKEFFKLLSAYAQDPFKFIENQTGFNFQGQNNTGSPNTPNVKLKMPNNPIENCNK